MSIGKDPEVSQWWDTQIIDMSPGVIRYRGYPVEKLVGNVTFAQMIWLMVRGELPTKGQSDLFESALTSAVDHGPQAPSIAVARMAITCGLGLNNAMASAVNLLGDVHGGAGEQAIALYESVAGRIDAGFSLAESVKATLEGFFASGGKFVPGFGHRFHPVDPRAPRLLELIDKAKADGVILGRYAEIARSIELEISTSKGKLIPMNIDGATAAIYAELGFAPPLARGLFCLSRSVGILAHSWEQSLQGERNKGPIPRSYIWSYSGEVERPLPAEYGGGNPR